MVIVHHFLVVVDLLIYNRCVFIKLIRRNGCQLVKVLHRSQPQATNMKPAACLIAAARPLL